MAQRVKPDETDLPSDEDEGEEPDPEDVGSAGEGDEDDDEDEDDGHETITKSEKQRLHQEAARHRIRAKQFRAERDTAQAELKKLQEDGISDPDHKKTKEERDGLQVQVDTLIEENTSLRISQEVTRYMGDLKLNPAKLRQIIKVMETDDVDVEEDGKISGVREALEVVAQDNPEWVMSASGDDDEEGNKVDRTSGQSSSRPRRTKKPTVDKNRLMNTFPALQQGYVGQ